MPCVGIIWADVGHECDVNNCPLKRIAVTVPDQMSHSPSNWTFNDLKKLGILYADIGEDWFFGTPAININNMPLSANVLNGNASSKTPIAGDPEATHFFRYMHLAMIPEGGESRVDDFMGEVLRLVGFHKHGTLLVTRQKNDPLYAGGVPFVSIPDISIHSAETNGLSFPRLVIENKIRGTEDNLVKTLPQLFAEGFSAAQQFMRMAGNTVVTKIPDILGIITIGTSPVFVLLNYNPILVSCVGKNTNVPKKVDTGSAHYFIPVPAKDVKEYFEQGMTNVGFRKAVFYYLLAFIDELFSHE